LSGFLSRCGLLQAGAALSIRQLYERYKKGNDVLSIRARGTLDATSSSLASAVIGWKYAIAIRTTAFGFDSSDFVGPPSAARMASPNPSLVRNLQPPATATIS
jgi:hypothetical protein